MRHILLPNAQLAWMQAVRCADALHDGRATLQKKKQFVSSLHNAVELFTKQYMLDVCDYGVVEPKKISKKNIDLYSRFFAAIDLNQFFLGLTNDELQTFYTIEFSQLNERIKEMITPPSLGDAFSKLKNLRNEQTHFYIHPDDYLKNDQFISLYNFMIDFYNGIRKMKYLPICSWTQEKPDRNEKKYRFDRKRQDSSFNYKRALKQSQVVKQIKEELEKLDPIETLKALSSVETQQAFTEESVILAVYLIEKCHFDNNINFETLVDYIVAMDSQGILNYHFETEEIPNTRGEDDELDEENKTLIPIGLTISVKI